LFQSVYQPAPSVFGTLPLTPEWHLFGVVLVALAGLGILWPPLALTLPLLVFVVGASSVQAALSAAEASFSGEPRARISRLTLLGVTALLHLLQPLARLRGRLGCVRIRQRGRSLADLSSPRPRTLALWSERWRAADEWLGSTEAALLKADAAPLRGGDYDRWDLEVRGGRLGGARLRMAVEEHGGGKQLVRFRVWPRYSIEGIGAILLLAVFSIGAALDQAWVVSILLGTSAAMLIFRSLWEWGVALDDTSAALQALESVHADVVALAGNARTPAMREDS
jgi:hypothetical protein